MPFYIAEVRDSNGNDCTVFDALIQAYNREAASKTLWAYIEEAYPDDESDGGYGTYHACDCACEHFVGNGVVGLCEGCADTWECSHGGILTQEPSEFEEYGTMAEARRNLRRYHSQIDLT